VAFDDAEPPDPAGSWVAGEPGGDLDNVVPAAKDVEHFPHEGVGFAVDGEWCVATVAAADPVGAVRSGWAASGFGCEVDANGEFGEVAKGFVEGALAVGADEVFGFGALAFGVRAGTGLRGHVSDLRIVNGPQTPAEW
jgi:hypothetical protein